MSPSTETQYGFTPVESSAQRLLSSVKPTPAAPFIPVSETPIPDTALSQRIDEYARSHLPAPTYNHSRRVYHYGLAIKSHLFPSWSFTDETYFLACVLHDIGTTETNLLGTKMSFEFYGGFLALDVLQKSAVSDPDAVAPRDQAESVAEAIIRHQDLCQQGKITAVGQLLQLATIFDNTGAYSECVHPSTIEDVTTCFPRMKWSSCFAATIHRENELKPWSHTTTLGEYEFPAKVLGNKLMEPFE
ncbi:unnamed protein product [Penicillium olsonii]|uniref:HD domain-containing protein n=1 Tax=Penicillium olsonii TaxID=99116 RepID=A0A9W4HR03_PENOL|nr:unnamed protein product [Penicillium olsonii]CAG8094226.1 unnamed protein product [Penicillium olsonii]CAG8144973.1 unnamed protein product [Penicillium olsonii]